MKKKTIEQLARKVNHIFGVGPDRYAQLEKEVDLNMYAKLAEIRVKAYGNENGQDLVFDRARFVCEWDKIKPGIISGIIERGKKQKPFFNGGTIEERRVQIDAMMIKKPPRPDFILSGR